MSRALYNLSEIFWLKNMLIYFLKFSFLKKINFPPNKSHFNPSKIPKFDPKWPKVPIFTKNLNDFNVATHY